MYHFIFLADSYSPQGERHSKLGVCICVGFNVAALSLCLAAEGRIDLF